MVLGSFFDTYNNDYNCAKGYRSGLIFAYEDANTGDVAKIPYGQTVEMPFYVSNAGSCLSYQDVKVTVAATCEMATSSSQVYQYGVVPNVFPVQISYDEKDRISASAAAALFSVSWTGVTSRRLSSEEGSVVSGGYHDTQGQSSMVASQKDVLDLRTDMEKNRNELMEKIEMQREEIKSIRNEILEALKTVLSEKKDE